MGKVEALWTKRAHRGPMDPTDRVTVEAGQGIVDDANHGRRRRQVTVIEREVFDRIHEELPDVQAIMRRANVMVSGVSLADTLHRVLRLGDVRIHIRGNTRPCERMDEQVPGLTAALHGGWDGGAFGIVLDDGEISVGADATLEGVLEERGARPSAVG